LCVCPKCNTEYIDTGLFETSNEIEVNIRVKRKVHKRKIYKQKCNCEESKVMIVAEKPQSIIPKSKYSTYSWCMFIILKYYLQIPLNRQLKLYEMGGLDCTVSTIIGGFSKIMEFLEPLYLLLKKECKKAYHLHADETRWRVFEEREGKKNYNWWMWLFKSKEAVVYILDESRSSKVPQDVFSGKEEGILSVDRYSSYKILCEHIELAFCWYHVRRDFVKLIKSNDEISKWCLNWIKEINELEKLNKDRLELPRNSDEYKKSNTKLKRKAARIINKAKKELINAETEPQRKVMKSLIKHWDGLTIFIDNPQIPMHNNEAERALRSVAVARNNFYGSQNEWSGKFNAICLSILHTAVNNKIDAKKYLFYYLDECSKNSSVPENLKSFLPFNLSEEKKKELSLF
jgi:transposase